MVPIVCRGRGKQRGYRFLGQTVGYGAHWLPTMAAAWRDIERQTTLGGIIAVLQSDGTTASPQSRESSSAGEGDAAYQAADN